MGRRAQQWPNVERLVVAWLKARTGRPVYTETDSGLDGHLPAYQVTRAGGGQGAEIDRQVQVEVVTIGGTRDQMWGAVALAESAMYALSANGTEAWYVDEVTETFGPAVVPSGNAGQRRATATYALTLRPQ